MTPSVSNLTVRESGSQLLQFVRVYFFFSKSWIIGPNFAPVASIQGITPEKRARVL
jgi:hypothetical protein